MKNLTKFGLTFLSATLLAACGSSGGGDNSQPAAANSVNSGTTASNVATTTTATRSSSSSTTTTNNNNNSDTSTNTSSTSSNTPTSTAAASNSEKMGAAFRAKDAKQFELEKASTYKNELVVDGKTLPVAYPGILSGGFTQIGEANINGVTYKNAIVSGAKFGNVKFGYVDGYAFVQGDVTKASEIPTTGSATYNVDSVFIENGVATTSNGHNLTVDFANKTLNGNVAPNVSVSNANINGNGFEGKAVYQGKSADLAGYFYGSNAAEIGGAYASSDFAGAFGGKKQ